MEPEGQPDAARQDESSEAAWLEQSWAGRERPIRGRELRIELWTTAIFLLLAGALALSAGVPDGFHPIAAAVVVAFAIAARVEFPIGAGFFVPTQLFLVPLFVVAPAEYVPLLVFVAFGLAAVAAGVQGSTRFDRVIFSAGDSVHALGPALVFAVFGGGDATEASVLLIAAAFLAQLAADLLSSSVHDIVTMRARPDVHLRIMLQTWSVDVTLGSVGLLAAMDAVDTPVLTLAPLLLVLLLRGLAADRVRKISTAHERLVALEVEQGKREAAGQLLERQTRFLQDVSHELRTPVTIARGHVENLRRAAGPTPEADVALDELARIGRIVERLLVMARADQPETFPRAPVDAEAFVEDCFVRWSDTVPRPWRLDAVVAGRVSAHRDALRAALDALLENAVKHTTPAQQIRVGSRVQDGALVIEVADRGNGIPASALEQVFRRFARASGEGNTRTGGVGLGLATVDAVAKAHGGRCEVSSSPAGSVFSLHLPGFEPAPTTTPSESAPAAERLPAESVATSDTR